MPPPSLPSSPFPAPLQLCSPGTISRSKNGTSNSKLLWVLSWELYWWQVIGALTFSEFRWEIFISLNTGYLWKVLDLLYHWSVLNAFLWWRKVRILLLKQGSLSSLDNMFMFRPCLSQRMKICPWKIRCSFCTCLLRPSGQTYLSGHSWHSNSPSGEYWPGPQLLCTPLRGSHE